MHTCISSHGLKRSWRSSPRRVNGGNKNTPSTHHPRRRNVTTLMAGLKNGHIRKNLTQSGEPQRYSWGTQKTTPPPKKKLTLGQPVPGLTLKRQAPCREFTGVPVLSHWCDWAWRQIHSNRGNRTQGPVSWRPATVKLHSSTVIPPSALDKPSIMKRYHRRRTTRWGVTARSPTMVNASWYSVCWVPMVECENCRHLTVVGLHDTGPRSAAREADALQLGQRGGPKLESLFLPDLKAYTYFPGVGSKAWKILPQILSLFSLSSHNPTGDEIKVRKSSHRTQRNKKGPAGIVPEQPVSHRFACTINNRESRFLRSPHWAANWLQHIRSSGLGAIVCLSHATHRALNSCNMSCATWFEGTPQLFSMTEFSSSSSSAIDSRAGQIFSPVDATKPAVR